jgi:hypothetical protein
VTGVTAARGGLVAVGGESGRPVVWAWEAGGAWRTVASSTSFPNGGTLSGVAASEGDLVAVGSWVADGVRRPAAFRSATGGSSWEVVPATPEAAGTLTAVAVAGGRVFAVGTRFAEREVGEPGDLIAGFADADGWRAVEPAGMPRPRHGAATLLAGTAEGALVGITDVDGHRLYFGSPAGPWRSIATPSVAGSLSIVAAGAAGDRTILAGIDALDRARFWLGGSRGWRETGPPTGLPTGGKVRGFAEPGSDLVAAGVGPTAAFVEEVAV